MEYPLELVMTDTPCSRCASLSEETGVMVNHPEASPVEERPRLSVQVHEASPALGWEYQDSMPIWVAFSQSSRIGSGSPNSAADALKRSPCRRTLQACPSRMRSVSKMPSPRVKAASSQKPLVGWGFVAGWTRRRVRQLRSPASVQTLFVVQAP